MLVIQGHTVDNNSCSFTYVGVSIEVKGGCKHQANYTKLRRRNNTIPPLLVSISLTLMRQFIFKTDHTCND